MPNHNYSGPQSYELFKTIMINLQLHPSTSTSAARKLIHDLTSAANAFQLLVEQLAAELEDERSERTTTKVSQLRTHVKLNKCCIEAICDALVKEAADRRS